MFMVNFAQNPVQIAVKLEGSNTQPAMMCFKWWYLKLYACVTAALLLITRIVQNYVISCIYAIEWVENTIFVLLEDDIANFVVIDL